MLLQTNSYVVPKDKRAEHARLVRRFRQTLARLGCDHFEVYEQVGANWSGSEATGRYVHIMRFRDRKHQLAVQQAERTDPGAQALINEFCELINFPYQQQHGLFAVGFYTSALPDGGGSRELPHAGDEHAHAEQPAADEATDAAAEDGGNDAAEPAQQHEMRLVGDDDLLDVPAPDDTAEGLQVEVEPDDAAADRRHRGGKH
jgi:hypothetical protein